MRRYINPGMRKARPTPPPSVISGCTDWPARSGTMLLMMTGVANTDPEVFGHADFDITTDQPESPLTFGRGIHFCLGAPLARAQMAEALPILAQRLGRIE